MIYHCIIEQEENEYIVSFPDLSNILTCGFNEEEALVMASDALNGVLEVSISHGLEIPPPSYTGGYPIRVYPHIALSLQLRKLRGSQSQSEIASKLGLTYQAYQRLENPRKANPTVKTLEKIARIYGRELKIII
ncbi:MAG: type II toxin-antitoxin system HicB family antitoxin [Spirochaetaceae bacterium]|nr:type II toxin-antitoxin system HicB family antitoxin [Spirochaetaceae bacterium]